MCGFPKSSEVFNVFPYGGMFRKESFSAAIGDDGEEGIGVTFNHGNSFTVDIPDEGMIGNCGMWEDHRGKRQA